VNGKEITTVRQGTTAVHYVFEQVMLEKGTNSVSVTSGSQSDSVEWVLE